MPTSRVTVIFVLTTTTMIRPITLPLAHARRVINFDKTMIVVNWWTMRLIDLPCDYVTISLTSLVTPHSKILFIFDVLHVTSLMRLLVSH